MWIRVLFAVLMCSMLGLTGCQTGRAFVLTSADGGVPKYASYRLLDTTTDTTLSSEFRAHFAQSLASELAGKDPESPSVAGPNSLLIKYRFVYYDPGNGTKRAGAFIVSLVGVPTGSIGMGQLAVEATFADASGKQLALIVADGPIDGPISSTKDGLETAAQTISNFAKQNFLIAQAKAPAPAR